MKKYFYTKGKDKFGPFTIEELSDKGLTSETLIWAEGMADWQQLKDIPEFAEALRGYIPPPSPYEIKEKMTKETRKETIKEILIGIPIVLYIAMFFSVAIFDFPFTVRISADPVLCFFTFIPCLFIFFGVFNDGIYGIICRIILWIIVGFIFAYSVCVIDTGRTDFVSWIFGLVYPFVIIGDAIDFFFISDILNLFS